MARTFLPRRRNDTTIKNAPAPTHVSDIEYDSATNPLTTSPKTHAKWLNVDWHEMTVARSLWPILSFRYASLMGGIGPARYLVEKE